MLNTSDTDCSILNFSNFVSQNSFRKSNDIQPWNAKKKEKNVINQNKQRLIQSSRRDQINDYLNQQLFKSQSIQNPTYKKPEPVIEKQSEKQQEKQDQLKIIYFPQMFFKDQNNTKQLNKNNLINNIVFNETKSWQKGNFQSKDARRLMQSKGFVQKNACSVRGTSGKLQNNKYLVNQNLNTHSYTVK